MCQELHGLNGFHLGDKIALFVYTRGEQWVIFKRGPNQNGSNEKFIMFHWDTELEILQDLFLSRGGEEVWSGTVYADGTEERTADDIISTQT